MAVPIPYRPPSIAESKIGEDFWHWFTTADPEGLKRREALMEHGGGLLDTWTKLPYQEEPKDLIGKIFWWAGVSSQLIINLISAPFGIAAFLLEESAQSIGIGAYMLYTSKNWEALNGFFPIWKNSLEVYERVAKTFAVFNPVGAGAVLIFLDAAKHSAGAMYAAMLNQVTSIARAKGIKEIETRTVGELLELIKIAEADQAGRATQEAQQYGTLALKSIPTGAMIYLDQMDTGLETPETFKKITAGSHEVALAKFNTKTQLWDAYLFTIKIDPGRKKEVTIHIPPAVTDDIAAPGKKQEVEGPQLPDFIKTQVTGERTIDGDTFETTTGERIRILGLDAPEIGRPYADLATEFLRSKADNHKLEISIQTHLPIDAYGRTLAIVWYRDENIAVSEIAAGLAKAFIADDARYDPTRYLEAERLAKERRIGIWSEIP